VHSQVLQNNSQWSLLQTLTHVHHDLLWVEPRKRYHPHSHVGHAALLWARAKDHSSQPACIMICCGLSRAKGTTPVAM
jgi:hypothetical protein